MHTTLASIASVLMFLQAGYLALRLISGARIRARLTAGDPPGVSESLALSYGIGVGLVSTELLVLSLLGIRFTVFRVLTLWLVAWVLYLLMRRRTVSRESSPVAPRDRELWSLALLIPLAAIVLLMLLRATFTPPWAWDEWAIWDLKARAFYLDRDVVRFAADGHYGLSRGLVPYPILYPLAGTLLYLMLGSHDGPVQIIPVLFYASALVVFFSTLRRLGSGRGTAALLTTGLGFLPNLLYWTILFQAESPLVFYALTYACYLFLYSRDPRSWYLVVAALSAGFLTQIRPDGLAIIGPGALWLAARARRESRPLMIFVGAVACIYAPWFILTRFVASAPEGGARLDLGQITAGLHLIPEVLGTMLAWMSDATFMGPYVLLFPLTLLMIVMNWRRYARLSGEGVLLLTALVSLVPYIVLLITVPYWLTVSAMGRYLLTCTCIVYLVFALHAADGAAGEPVLGGAEGVKLTVTVSIAVAATVLLTSAPDVLFKIRSHAVSWTFRDGAAGWADETGAAAQTVGDALALPADGRGRIGSPPVRVDADVTRSLTLVARGARGANGRLNIAWKRVSGEYTPDQSVSIPVEWTGVYQPVVVGLPWRGTIAELRLGTEGEGAVFVQSIGTEPAWLGMVALVLRKATSNLSIPVAFSLAFLAAGSFLQTRVAVLRLMPIGFAAFILILWLLPDVSPVLAAATGGRDVLRPIGLARQVFTSWTDYGRYPLAERLQRLEASRGRPYFFPLIRETAVRCGTGANVVVWAPPGSGDADPGGYVFQRLSYLLYPSKVSIVNQAETLTRALRDAPGSALILYGVPPPPGLSGRVDYSPAPDFAVSCAPMADSRH